jgi:CRISPR-associated exonuclease Cas4
MHTLDDDVVLVPISAIEHYSYCPRQCALIHVEQTYDENLYTMRGNYAHERVDKVGGEVRKGVTVRRGLSLWSRRLQLTGRADAVEFLGRIPYPVEYKVGARRAGGHEDLQLCAQALCLEEMFDIAVPEGAIYYHASRHREEIAIDAALRQRTEEVVAAIRRMLDAERLPTAPNDARCRHCSLFESCLPGVVSGARAELLYHTELFAIRTAEE